MIEQTLVKRKRVAAILTAAGIAAGAAGLVTGAVVAFGHVDAPAPTPVMARLAPPADLDAAHHAFDRFRDTPQVALETRAAARAEAPADRPL